MTRTPIRLSPITKSAIWGGTKLKKHYGKQAEGDAIAESWELSACGDSITHSTDGTPITALTGISAADFPILVKFLDAGDTLSIQVHPAKNEFWYVMEAEEGASLLYGLAEDADRDTLRKALENGTAEQFFCHVPVKKGDCFFIPSGLVHAIGGGILLAEIQQSSDTTYRLYDYGRLQPDGTPRQLHVEQGLAAIRHYTDEELTAARFDRRATRERNGDLLCCCRNFVVRRYDVVGEQVIYTPALHEAFAHLLCVGGEGRIGVFRSEEESQKADIAVRAGDSFLLPQHMGELYVSARDGMEFLIVTP